MPYKKVFISIAQDKKITHQPRRVLDYLMSKLSFEQFMHIPHSEVVSALNMQKSNVSKAISVLLNQKILISGPKLGKTSSYKINLDYGNNSTN